MQRDCGQSLRVTPSNGCKSAFPARRHFCRRKLQNHRDVLVFQAVAGIRRQKKLVWRPYRESKPIFAIRIGSQKHSKTSVNKGHKWLLASWLKFRHYAKMRTKLVRNCQDKFGPKSAQSNFQTISAQRARLAGFMAPA
jgi:hypothetical protein